MEKRTLGKSNLEVSAIGLRLYGNERWLRPCRRQERDDLPPSVGRRTRRYILRHC